MASKRSPVSIRPGVFMVSFRQKKIMPLPRRGRVLLNACRVWTPSGPTPKARLTALFWKPTGAKSPPVTSPTLWCWTAGPKPPQSRLQLSAAKSFMERFDCASPELPNSLQVKQSAACSQAIIVHRVPRTHTIFRAELRYNNRALIT